MSEQAEPQPFDNAEAVIEHLVAWAAPEDMQVYLRDRGMTIPASQAWFWTEAWQRGEREADEDRAAGRTRMFDSAEEFLAYLHGESQ